MEKDYTGWLSPEGEMIYCSFHEHLEIAEELIKKYYNYESSCNTTPDEDLMYHGWIHVSFENVYEYGYDFVWKERPTYRQKKFMETFVDRDDIVLTDSCKYRIKYYC